MNIVAAVRGLPLLALLAGAIVSGSASAGPSLSAQAADSQAGAASPAAPVQPDARPDARPVTRPDARPDGAAKQPGPDSAALVKAIGAVVKLRTKAVPDARSLQTLGAQREGSAIVIGKDNLLLTIGYLIIEAETVEVENSDGKLVPATVVAYDHASGFGLVRALAPLNIPPIELGASGQVLDAENAIFAAAGGIDAASSVVVVSKRRFAGYWEYMIDDALFTSPPRVDHSGAALIDRNGRLIGVGSLIVGDTLPSGDKRKLPGNMFVPIDLLKPIFDEMVATGSSSKGKQPWLGITSQELEGRVFVQRVQKDSPAEAAGLRQGDILLSIGSEKISKLEDFYTNLWRDRRPGDEVTLTVLQGTEIRKITVKSIDRRQYVRTKTSI